MSSVGWVDFSSEDRQRVLDVLALLKEKGTLDELGIGQVRDAFSDLLFPGFSTIQTSARYFLTIPKILCDWADLTKMQREKIPLSVYLAREENALAKRLAENHKRLSLSLEGIIGHTLLEKGGAARLPSSTYWNGMRVFGIVRTDVSLSEFCRSWAPDTSSSHRLQADDGEDDDEALIEDTVWRPPGAKKNWPSNLTLQLSPSEARHLSEKFLNASDQQNSVVAQLIATSLLSKALQPARLSFDTFSDWAKSQPRLSKECRYNLQRAKNFSLAMEGAHIVYNRLIANKTGNRDLQERCAGRMAEWQDKVRQGQVFHAKADLEWLSVSNETNLNVRPSTREFLSEWNAAICENATDYALNRLVTTQAKRNKPGRSLLVKPLKKHEKWYGMDRLDYRWRNARNMLRELYKARAC